MFPDNHGKHVIVRPVANVEDSCLEAGDHEMTIRSIPWVVSLFNGLNPLNIGTFDGNFEGATTPEIHAVLQLVVTKCVHSMAALSLSHVSSTYFQFSEFHPPEGHPFLPELKSVCFVKTPMTYDIAHIFRNVAYARFDNPEHIDFDSGETKENIQFKHLTKLVLIVGRIIGDQTVRIGAPKIEAIEVINSFSLSPNSIDNNINIDLLTNSPHVNHLIVESGANVYTVEKLQSLPCKHALMQLVVPLDKDVKVDTLQHFICTARSMKEFIFKVHRLSAEDRELFKNHQAINCHGISGAILNVIYHVSYENSDGTFEEFKVTREVVHGATPTVAESVSQPNHQIAPQVVAQNAATSTNIRKAPQLHPPSTPQTAKGEQNTHQTACGPASAFQHDLEIATRNAAQVAPPNAVGSTGHQSASHPPIAPQPSQTTHQHAPKTDATPTDPQSASQIHLPSTPQTAKAEQSPIQTDPASVSQPGLQNGATHNAAHVASSNSVAPTDQRSTSLSLISPQSTQTAHQHAPETAATDHETATKVISKTTGRPLPTPPKSSTQNARSAYEIIHGHRTPFHNSAGTVPEKALPKLSAPPPLPPRPATHRSASSKHAYSSEQKRYHSCCKLHSAVGLCSTKMYKQLICKSSRSSI